MNMEFTHKGYKCTISYQSHYFAAEVHVSSIKEEKAFREYAESRLSEVLVDLTVEELKIQFIYLVERFLRTYEVDYPLYPKPELPNAKIDVMASEGIYLVPDNVPHHPPHTASVLYRLALSGRCAWALLAFL